MTTLNLPAQFRNLGSLSYVDTSRGGNEPTLREVCVDAIRKLCPEPLQGESAGELEGESGEEEEDSDESEE